MYTIGNLNFANAYRSPFGKLESIDVIIGDMETKHMQDAYTQPDDSNIIMQCTSKTDSKHKYIMEFDIIEQYCACGDCDIEDKGIGFVYYDITTLKWMVNYGDMELALWMQIDKKHVTVIGNIFEGMELFLEIIRKDRYNSTDNYLHYIGVV